MSRRKQAKPQHINSDEPGSAENGLLQDGQIEEEGTESKRFRMDETRVCAKCCAECFDDADFLKHQKNCTKSQQVVIVKDGGEARAEDFSRDSSSPDDGARSDNDHDLAGGGGNPPSDADAEPAERAGDEERPNSNGGDDSSSSSRQEQTVVSASPEMNYQPSPKQQNSNVTLESMPATKVAVTQHSWSRHSPPPTAQEVVQSIPLILEQLVSLQQQQLQQIQLTEQIRIQVAMMAPQSLHSAMGAAVDPLKALGAHLSQQLSAAAALIGKRTGSQSLTMEAMKLGKLPQPDPPPGLGASKSDLCKGLPDLAGRLPALLPQSPGALAFPGSFTGLPASMDPSKKPKVKIPNAPYETKNGSGGSGGGGGDPAFKHKCKYCGKTFGNDSALQIHLRSHTGERPFKCNICGNRFTTKGNLKVHFQRHREKYPHVRMNPHPVPEHLDHVPTSSGIPYGMSMPIEESNMVDVKPTIGHLAAAAAPAFHPSPSLQGFKSSSFDGFGGGGGDPFSHHRPSSSGSDGASISSHAFGIGHHEMGADHHNLESREPRHANGGGDPASSSATGEHNHISSGTAKLQQMVDGLEKRTGDPNECVICHRVLSCQSSLKMHYRTHTGERPYKCKICGRAFSTKGNLKAHYGVHRANTPLKMQHSCPICQKKFTNAVVLQQHIRMHMGGQIPNTPHVPENQYDNPADDANVSSPPDEKLMDAGGFDESMEDEDAELDSRERAGDAPSDPPLLFHQSGGEEQQQQLQRRAPPPPMFSGIAALENHMKNLTSALNLQRQSSTASESDGGGAGAATRGSPSSSSAAPPREPEYQNGRSPAVSDSASFHSSSSPVNSYVGSSQSKSPESAAPEDSIRNGTRAEPDMMGSQEAGESGGALDLTAPSSFVPKAIKEEPRAIKEEPGLPYSNGEYCAPSHMPYMRMVPSLTSLEMQIPSENPLGPHGLFGSPLSQGLGMSSPMSNQGAGMMASSSSSSSGSSAPRRSMKQHLCNACGKNFSSASALQIHERTHTGEKPFACTICGRAFTTKGNLKVHVGTHMWNNSSRRGQRLSLDNPMALMAMGSESGMMPDMMPPPPKELGGPPPMNFDQSLWNQYAAALTNGLSMKTNEISVIQNGGIPLPGSLSAGPLVGSTGGLMKLDGSHSGLPASMAEIEKSGSESVPKSQFPHFMEEGKIAVN